MHKALLKPVEEMSIIYLLKNEPGVDNLTGIYFSGKDEKNVTSYQNMTQTERQEEYAKLQAVYESLKTQGLQLDMTRGKPCKEQLDLVSDIFDMLKEPEDYMVDGIDIRNYGHLSGLPEAKRLFANILNCKPKQVFVGGNASLQLMYGVLDNAFLHGRTHSPRPWCKEPVVKWLCPAPGYDRHFKMTQAFGFELITIPMTSTGPDMDAVEEAIKDPAVKGIWCVPKYSNPDGVVYSMETVVRMASMKPAAPDFTIMWDNAYCIHEFEGEYVEFPDILHQCKKYDNYDMVYEFASTSKITFPGDGVACMATSEGNLKDFEKWIGLQTISYDKVNQQRHVLYLQNRAHTLKLMKKHASVMAPKFQAVLATLEREIADLEIAHWSKPKGGYFVSLYAMEGTAKRTLALCKEAGVAMTAAGATYPYGIDPKDSNIRIAPSYPPVEEVVKAIDVFCVCLKMAALEKLGV